MHRVGLALSALLLMALAGRTTRSERPRFWRIVTRERQQRAVWRGRWKLLVGANGR